MHYLPFPFWTCDLDVVIPVSFNCTYPLFSFSSTYLDCSIAFLVDMNGWLFTRFHSNDILSSSSSNVNAALTAKTAFPTFRLSLKPYPDPWYTSFPYTLLKNRLDTRSKLSTLSFTSSNSLTRNTNRNVCLVYYLHLLYLYHLNCDNP